MPLRLPNLQSMSPAVWYSCVSLDVVQIKKEKNRVSIVYIVSYGLWTNVPAIHYASSVDTLFPTIVNMTTILHVSIDPRSAVLPTQPPSWLRTETLMVFYPVPVAKRALSVRVNSLYVFTFDFSSPSELNFALASLQNLSSSPTVWSGAAAVGSPAQFGSQPTAVSKLFGYSLRPSQSTGITVYTWIDISHTNDLKRWSSWTG
jgi:hypothetical protein